MHDLGKGLGHLLKGQRWVLRHGRWWGFGLLPGLVALVLYIAALVALATYATDIASWATPFADSWSADWRSAVRALLAVLLVCGSLLLAVVTFTAVTLLIGQPFYESLSERVEEIEGGAPPAPSQSLWQQLVFAAREGLGSVLLTAGIGLLLLVLGFVPAIGQTVVPAAAFCVSGFFLTEQLAAVALQRRGLTFRQRIRRLRSRLGLTLGFGVPLVLLFLIPFVAVLLMPGAVAGATLLARELEPTAAPSPTPAPDGATPGPPPSEPPA
ncbi:MULTISPECIES: EI24 domain-containing protein [Streptacidiphilus]|uniref:EI24 domain-containing protein n=1 Tax=Streptacidiphilus cavernicola TaxID=3342716 RepID=A0ABV6UQY6_9ACTN|nr:EI24 domain-containing protein [Streptacidiphilus jeojiense]